MAHPAVVNRRGDPAEGWVVLSDSDPSVRVGHIPSPRAVVGRMVAAAAVVSLVIGAVAFFVSNRLAEQDTRAEGVRITDILAGEIRPHLNAQLAAGDPAMLDMVDAGVRPAMGQYGVLRVKVFDAAHRVLYSDERRLIGQSFDWSDVENNALNSDRAWVAITKPMGDENEYERLTDQLIEVRRSIVQTDGHRDLLEVYLNYDIVGARAAQMWRAFLVLLVGSLLLLTLMIIPVALQLLRRIAEGNLRREQLLQRAVDASDLERRRIAGSLHDGPVQDLVANTLALSSAAGRLKREGNADAAAAVADSASVVRGTVASLRSLLVDLYPPSLAEQGLAAAVDDLLTPLRARGVAASADLDATTLGDSDERLVFRVCQECLRNVGKHADATAVGVRLTALPDGWNLTVADNGHGFDARSTFADPAPGHIGMRILSDLAGEAGALLRVSSGPEGTTWELRRGGNA